MYFYQVESTIKFLYVSDLQRRLTRQSSPQSVPGQGSCHLGGSPDTLGQQYTCLCSRTHCSYLAEIGREAHLHILFIFSQSGV